MSLLLTRWHACKYAGQFLKKTRCGALFLMQATSTTYLLLRSEARYRQVPIFMKPLQLLL